MKLSRISVVLAVTSLSMTVANAAHSEGNTQIGSGTEFVLSSPYPKLRGKPSRTEPFEVVSYVQNGSHFSDTRGMIPGEPYCKLSAFHPPIETTKKKESAPKDFEVKVPQPLTDYLLPNSGVVEANLPDPFVFQEEKGVVNKFINNNKFTNSSLKLSIGIHCFDDNGDRAAILDENLIGQVFGNLLSITKLQPMQGWAHRRINVRDSEVPYQGVR